MGTTMFGSREVMLSDTMHVNFDYDTVVRMSWWCSTSYYDKAERLLEYYVQNENEIAVRFRSEPMQQRKDDTSLLTSMIVMKRYVDAERAVIVWRSMASATEPGVNDWDRTYSDEEGWVVMERVPEGVEGMEPGTAISRRHAILRPLWTDAPQSNTTLRPEDFDRLVVESTREDILAQDEIFENTLLDACIFGAEL